MGLLKCSKIYLFGLTTSHFFWLGHRFIEYVGTRASWYTETRENMSQIEKEKVLSILWLMKKWHTLTTRGTRERRELSKLSKTNKWQTGRGSFFLGPGKVGLFTNTIFIYSKTRMISCMFKISDSCLLPKVFNPIKLLSKICR